MSLLDKIFGNYSTKELKRVEPIVDKIESLESQIKVLSDEELKNKTSEFKERLAGGETLDDILPEAFAVVREASVRVLNLRHYRVQLIGGVVLHQGRISEMRTGEGKTLVATSPAYLNALTGKAVHIVTVNEYLASLQSEEMGRLFEFLGLKVGLICNHLTKEERQEQYAADITYSTNNELGFDYLRDNMVVYKEDRVQRDLSFAIIDEVDSILIDEARTPLIISGSSGKSTQLYNVADSFVKTLKKGKILNENEALNAITRADIIEEGDYVIDEKGKTVSLTQEGVKKAEKYFSLGNLADAENLDIQHHINNALKANYNMHKDKDYVVQNDEVVIVDEFTGRLMPGRRYSDGLHQAIEAKEKVKVNRESKTLATITFQNFFNKYAKKSGMTGTAVTEEGEFREIYGMDVVVIPTNMPVIRKDLSDIVYKNKVAKYRAVVNDIKECYERKQPVLVGTVSIEVSELVSSLLKKEGIPHQVLNAKYHEKEAEIVALAGQNGAITIATNMAGRGTDIKLEEGVPALGGLKIIGTERHESRRIDNQLRGRAGRQGDPGASRFYISLEDDLMRLFGSEKLIRIIEAMKMDENEPIEHSILSKSIENAQKKVEANNFSIRKHLLEYDRIMNQQREIIYSERAKVLEGQDLKDNILVMIGSVIGRAVDTHTGETENHKEWDILKLNEFLMPIFHKPCVDLSKEEETLTKQQLKDKLTKEASEIYEAKEQEIPAENLREIERSILLRIIDKKWMDHIDEMDQMRQGISLRAYAQKDPLLEYKFISYDMFDELGQNIQLDTLRMLFNIKVEIKVEREQVAKETSTSADDTNIKKPKVRKDEKIGRNEPCPCGSGKKYKACHGNMN